jgi:hypothetical protein
MSIQLQLATVHVGMVCIAIRIYRNYCHVCMHDHVQYVYSLHDYSGPSGAHNYYV